jgi:hypothetical protein
MGTVHENAALQWVKEWDSDPESAAIIPTYAEGLRTGRWSRDYLDTIGQLHRVGPSRWPRHQVAAFVLMHSYLMSGLVAQVEINVGRTPYPDAERDANASALANLPTPFVAHLDRTQRNAEQDGWLKLFCHRLLCHAPPPSSRYLARDKVTALAGCSLQPQLRWRDVHHGVKLGLALVGIYNP